MVLQLFLELLLIVTAFLFVRRRRSLYWAILIFGLVLLAGAQFFENYLLFHFDSSSFSLLSYQNLKSEFIISPDSVSIIFIKNVFPILLMLLWFNIFNYSEEYSLSATNIIILLFACVIFTLSSKDFIQLMVGSSCFSILGFFLIRDFLDKNKFVFYSFFSEMSLFVALAVVYSQTDNIVLNSLPQYTTKGHHQDLVSVLILISIFAKSAMFLFQDQLKELSRIYWPRGLAFSLLGSPFCGLILYNKLSSLIYSSSYGFIVLKLIISLSVVWGIIEICRPNSIKFKNMALNMMFFACYIWLAHNNKSFMSNAIYMLYVLFICNWICFTFTLKSKENILWFSVVIPLLLMIIYRINNIGTYDFEIIISYFSITLLGAVVAKILGNRFIDPDFQSQGYLSSAYNIILLSPLRFVGRILWLAVDFIVIERSLIGTFSSFSERIFSLCNKIQESTLRNWVFLILLGWVIILLNLGIYIYE